MTASLEDAAARREEDAERARIRRMLLDRGVLAAQITEHLIDFWIIQDARDQEEARSLGLQEERPHRSLFGGGG